MSEFKSFKKADLAKVARTVGIPVRSKDTKQSLLEKIEQFIQENPERAKELIEASGDEEAEVSTLVEVDATEDEEDDDDEVEEVEESENVDEDEDKDYNAPPPINLKEWVVDPAIDAFEQAHDAVLAFTDKVGMTTLQYNDELRESLSKTVTLNFLELGVEVAYFLYAYVPLVAVKDNKSVHQIFKDNVPHLQKCSFPIPDVTALVDFTVVSILFNWVLYAVAVPLAVAYYVNFSRRVVVIEDEEEEEESSFVVRLYKYDPFVFAVVKVVLFYFIFKNGALTTIDTYKGIVHALKNHVFIQLGIYHRFVLGMGNFPLIVGVANVVVALYSQFEDY